MKKIIIICALLFSVTSITIASASSSESASQISYASLPSEPTHRALGVTNPDRPADGAQQWFYYAYDSNGVIWIYGTGDVMFPDKIRTAPTGRRDFNYKFMRAGTVWYIAV